MASQDSAPELGTAPAWPYQLGGRGLTRRVGSGPAPQVQGLLRGAFPGFRRGRPSKTGVDAIGSSPTDHPRSSPWKSSPRQRSANRPEVYVFWHRLENLPGFMAHLDSVRRCRSGRCRSFHFASGLPAEPHRGFRRPATDRRHPACHVPRPAGPKKGTRDQPACGTRRVAMWQQRTGVARDPESFGDSDFAGSAGGG